MSDTKDKDTKSYSEKARIDAMDAENFDTTGYQKDAQGEPRKAVIDEEE